MTNLSIFTYLTQTHIDTKYKVTTLSHDINRIRNSLKLQLFQSYCINFFIIYTKKNSFRKVQHLFGYHITWNGL
ncbi:hypothetical protein BpHYR1_040724 [Brachionus plicatilis]|uniref:Uncharacterized protein n=1 Tax=Brachionus plicatilis TaxID=10195 RepID=A0A3M7P2T1_BRAPC|nr:hypothetical protein BpHYR1_040724 [Brachionus plicatilis]